MTKRRQKLKKEQPPPDIIIEEIKVALRRLSKILSPYEEDVDNLETKIHLYLTDDGLRLYYSLNNDWPARVKEAVKRTIKNTVEKYSEIVITSNPY